MFISWLPNAMLPIEVKVVSFDDDDDDIDA